jgi:hypothetical protein
MAMNLKNLFGRSQEEEYVEIDLNSVKPEENKIIVKPFVLKSYEGIRIVTPREFLDILTKS